ncbi:lysophospholipid acyltransferase family protein [Ilumatobacter sp.]|uniref:lysophospholipid acyltransferase family protein n=1 Tax=Ilumatobacter sp. TaxID=1967498 RepID=UPI003B520314
MSPRPVNAVLSIWGWIVMVASVLVFLPIVAVVRVVTMPFDRAAYAAGYVFRKVCVPLCTLNPLWSFTTSGRLPDDMRRPYVAVANHESFVDIVLISHLPTEMKWMSKVEIMKIPILGWMMRLSRDIEITRTDSDSRLGAVAQAHDRLGDDVSVMIFPEGTRSRTGEMRDFHAGAFTIAIDGQHPILPMAVFGTRDCLPADGWRHGRARAEVRVLDPIPTDGLTRDDLDDLRDRVRDVIAAAREQLRAEHASRATVDPGATGTG